MRELFQKLREEDLARVPAFHVGSRVRAWRPLVAVAAVVIFVVLGIVVSHHRRPPLTESIVTWKAPTDFLLRTPGSELLSTVPQIPERR